MGGMWRRRARLVVAVVHLGHAADAAASKLWILVAVTPAVNGSLDETPLAPERRVELRKRPAHRVAFGLILQTIAPILLLGAASPRVNTVLRLEIVGQLILVYRLHIATNRVFHLYAVPRILKGDPLHSIRILSHNQWSGGGNRARGSIGIHTSTGAGGSRKRSTVLGSC